MYSKFDIASLGDKIHFHRKRIGFTQGMLANKLHISYQAISAWENSQTLPDIENLCRLSEVFGISLDEMLSKDTSSPTLMMGIDGGGTKTEFVVFSPDGTVLKQICLSGSNSSHVGIEGTLSILQEGIDTCLDEFADIQYIHAGIAGPNLSVIQKKLKERYFGLKIVLHSDAINALKSADGEFALICGTGSILITKDKNGQYRKIGGWGSKFGDPCSAYNFGKAALKCGLAYEDGILADDTIYRMLIEKTGVSNIHSHSVSLDAPSIAKLAPIVFEAYLKNCKSAKDIIISEAKELSELLNSAFPNGGRVITCGSVIKHNGNILIPLLKKYTKDNFSFISPVLPPIYGASVACCDEFNIERNAGFKGNFEKSYNKL
ncbi:MAG: XRE family transcriptional regulator [Ruminococcaceae bacterium]|nr:XRE family transcriptional regulator [Oscillospiraceae bacterium]